ncbi:DUF7848 domain-containing protein [Streptomyces sp. GQFP]|uniref:DUF7848 domain-containing protein n=1 Tax=Streptomyces sp. GQFP TaxID=2907545 RepID=UPI001F1E75BF|nr:hypothetical protein [Streptomyces sp. GQFP]UIX32936.1 hypothetical protein LUX31_24575 [Streptomyces sp. GQFP]
MTRRIFRYVAYALVQDLSAYPEYAARCVSGEEKDCGAESGTWPGPGEVEEWQRRHTQETRHTRYRRVFADYAVMEPTEGPDSPPPGTEVHPVELIPGEPTTPPTSRHYGEASTS